MPIPLRSGSMELAEAMVFFGVNVRANGGPRLEFAVVSLERLREARWMMDLLYEYHSTGEIQVTNLSQIRRASSLDRVLVEMKDALIDIFHPGPGAEGEELIRRLDLGEEPKRAASKIRLDDDTEPTVQEGDDAFDLAELEIGGETGLTVQEDAFFDSSLFLDELILDEPRLKKEIHRGVPGSSVEERIKEGLKRGEIEQHKMEELKVLANSLGAPDVQGVLPREVVGKIQSNAYRMFHSLRMLQKKSIPDSLSEIHQMRSRPVVMPQSQPQ